MSLRGLDYMTELYTEKSLECKKLKAANEKLKNEKKNLLSLIIDQKPHMIISTYSRFENDYIVYISDFTHKGICAFDMDFISYNLTSEDLNFRPEVKANIEIIDNVLKIVRIDAAQFGMGHGGIMLDKIEEYAQANGVIKIWGYIDVYTPIGVDNLIKFYQKHKYEIVKKSTMIRFKKHLA